MRRFSYVFASMLVLSIVVVAAQSVRARFMRPDLVNIPVDRLVDNLEKMAKQKPKDVNVRFNLARVHAMAYAKKTDMVQVNRDRRTKKVKPERGAWLGFTPKAVPFKAQKAKTPKQKDEAQKHLQKALHRYAEVVKMKSDHLAAKLGSAWLLDQSGRKMEAVAAYRKIITTAWVKEGKMRFGGLGGNFITAETAGYLIPHLDKKKDAEEIQSLQQRIAKLKKLPRPITPIAIPLSDGLTAKDILDPTAKVRFDADGSEMEKSWTWIRPNAGWLVFDRQGNKKITSALQMFGNVSFMLFWDNGYEAMATLDNDGDGYLAGDELRHLAIWRDANGNGVSEANEVKSLGQWGILKLSCQFEKDATSQDCAAFSVAGVHFRNSIIRPTYDVILRQR